MEAKNIPSETSYIAYKNKLDYKKKLNNTVIGEGFGVG